MYTLESAAILVISLSLSLAAAPARAEDHPPAQVALVGCAHIHTPSFVKILKSHPKDVVVKYVWDHDAERAKKRAEELGAPVEADVGKIFADPAITAVIICSETDRHMELVTAAAKAHKHIFAEKPLGMNAKDAAAMAAAVESAGVLFETGYFMRSDAKHIFLKEQVAAGAFGTITRVRGSNCHSGALGGWFDTEWRWMADPKIAGIGGFGDLGTHSLDLILWIMGDGVEATRATATVANGTARYPNCDEYGTGLLTLKSGTIVDVAAGWDDVADPVTLEICGTQGHATIVNGSLYFQSQKVKGADGKKPWTDLPKAWPVPMELFIEAINGKKDVPLVSVREAAYRCAVVDALYAGAREGKWVGVGGK
jgi:predicted dehydrogenase